MNRILSIAILLLTLLPLARVSAQNWVNESMHECEDDGFTYMTDLPCEGFVECREMCPSCESYQDCEDMESHSESCKFYCSWCGKTMTIVESRTHNCQEDELDWNRNCVFCGMPLDLCICSGPEIRPSSEPSPIQPSPTPPSPPKPQKPKKDWTPGDYLFPDSCQTFFKDSLMIMQQQESESDCVSASLTNCVMWQNNYPLEKYDSIKKAIEDSYELLYKRPLKDDGVQGYRLDIFICGGCDINARSIIPSSFRTYINEGFPIGVIRAKYRRDKPKDEVIITGHFLTIVGYDKCKDLYLCYDTQEKKLIEYDLATLQATNFLYQIIK